MRQLVFEVCGLGKGKVIYEQTSVMEEPNENGALGRVKKRGGGGNKTFARLAQNGCLRVHHWHSSCVVANRKITVFECKCNIFQLNLF